MAHVSTFQRIVIVFTICMSYAVQSSTAPTCDVIEPRRPPPGMCVAVKLKNVNRERQFESVVFVSCFHLATAAVPCFSLLWVRFHMIIHDANFSWLGAEVRWYGLCSLGFSVWIVDTKQVWLVVCSTLHSAGGKRENRPVCIRQGCQISHGESLVYSDPFWLPHCSNYFSSGPF